LVAQYVEGMLSSYGEGQTSVETRLSHVSDELAEIKRRIAELEKPNPAA
jgi:hypothetical protein